jgi:Domain of unknown function (DUF6438)
MRAVALALALAAACGAKSPSAPLGNTGGAPGGGHELLATLERTACFGWCPIYKVTVYRDGAVEWNGDSFVKVKGQATGHLGPDDVAALEKLFVDNGYLALEDAYDDYSVTDMPSSITSYSVGGKTKTIHHYHGDQHAPDALRAVEDGIDRLVHTDQWLGTEDEREKQFGH